MGKTLQLTHAIWLYVLVTWSAACYAAESITLAKGLGSIPLADIGTALFLAIIGGVTGTLVKLSRLNHGVTNLALEITKDVMSSLVVGLLAFFFSNFFKWIDVWAQAGGILLAGYGGSKVLDVMLDDGAIPWLRVFFNRLLGKPAPPTQTPPPP